MRLLPDIDVLARSVIWFRQQQGNETGNEAECDNSEESVMS